MRLKTVVLAILAVALVAVAKAPQVDAQLLDRFHRFCFEELEILELMFEPRIPVGCEVVDCCPGCPGPLSEIDWVIRLEGEVAQGLELTFDRLPVSPEQLEVEGARWDGQRLVVPPGETVIRGLARATGERPPVGVARLRFDREAIRSRAAAHDEGEGPEGRRADADRAGDTVELHVEQRIGRYLVNEYHARLVVIPCSVPLQDRIDLGNNADNDSAVVLVDGRRAGCVNDEIRRGSDVIPVGNLRARAGCRAETVVFSDGDAMQLRENVGVWTNATGDLQPVDQTPDALAAPVSVWLMRPGAGFPALFDVVRASSLYDDSNCGSRFTIASFQDRSGNAGQVALLNGFGCSAAQIAALQASAVYTAGRLNAYYVNGAFTAFNCIADRNISVVGTLANNQSLAHEFGHAYSLGHTNAIATIPNTNVMHGGGAGRTDFTEGQCFRTNVNPASMLNVNGVRAGSTRACPDGTATSACPRLDLDVDPD